MGDLNENELQIVEAVHSYQAEMLDFIQSLIAIPTENPPGKSYLSCVELLAGKMRAFGLAPEIIQVPRAAGSDMQPRYCLIGSHGMGLRTLYFHGHYDVVPAVNPIQFKPYILNSRLFGRGSSDMKSGLAIMIYAVKAIRDCGIELEGKIGLVIVPDEETGGELGSGYLSRAGLLGRNGIGMLMPEPTSGVIWNANRGAISLRVTIKGKPAHVGLHYQGVNAFEQMLVVAAALRELKTEIESRRTDFFIEPEAARRSILMMGGQAGGGTNFNLVPSEFSFTIDRRMNPEEDLVEEKQRLFTLFDRLRREGIDLEVELLQEGKSGGSDQEDPLAVALAGSLEAVTGHRPAFELCPGLLETRFYADRNIPAYAYGPGLLEVSHGPEEYVSLADITDSTAIYALTAIRLLSKSVR